MKMEDVHRAAGQVLGELSLAIVRQSASKATMQRWIRVLRETADAFEAKVEGRTA